MERLVARLTLIAMAGLGLTALAAGSPSQSSDRSWAPYSKTDQGPVAEKSKKSPPTTVSLSASPQLVYVGNSVTLNWSSANAKRCTASGSWSGAKSVSGSTTVSNISQDQNFVLSCTGKKGSATASVSVTVVSRAFVWDQSQWDNSNWQ
jgi:hypothetical protein